MKVRDFIEGQLQGQDEQKTHDELLTTDIEKWLYSEKYGTVKAGSFDRLEQIYLNQIKPYIEGIKTKNVRADPKGDCPTKGNHESISQISTTGVRAATEPQ